LGIKESIASNFIAFDVVHNPCTCNLVGHNLDALGASLSQGTDLVLDSIPFCIWLLVAKDLAFGL
jgi:hypothetical protein